MKKHGLLVGRNMIINKAQDIHFLIFGSTSSVEFVGHGWCNLFINNNQVLTLILAQVIRWESNKEIFVGKERFF